MKSKLSFLTICAALVLTPTLALAQNSNADAQNNPDTSSQPQISNLAKQIREKLNSLPDYDVFDSLGFAINGRTVVLKGYASRPILKSEAEKAVKSIEGVESVDNQIQVLPPSPNDDRIRMEVYRRIYSQPAMRKYTSGEPGFERFPSVAMAAGGITQDPPLGYHAIHIVVNNGKVLLTGVVDSKSDADIAAIQANSTPGVFSVQNELQVAGSGGSREK